jgi:hypothetical protein
LVPDRPGLTRSGEFEVNVEQPILSRRAIHWRDFRGDKEFLFGRVPGWCAVEKIFWKISLYLSEAPRLLQRLTNHVLSQDSAGHCTGVP